MVREHMRTRRVELGLTMRQAAEKAGITESYWSYIENGTTPSLHVAGRIAAVLDESPEKLFAELSGGDAA